MEFLTDEQSGWPVGGICHLGNNQVNEALGLDLTRYGAFIWGQWTPCCPFWTLKFTQVISQGQTEAWLRYCLLTPFLLSSNSLLNPLSPPLTHHSLSVFPLSPNLMHHLPCLVFSFIFSYLSPLQQESALEADSLISPLSPCFWIHLPFPQVAAPALLPRWRTRRVDEAGQGKKKKVEESSRHEEWGCGHSKGPMVLTVVERRAFCLPERSCSWPSQPQDLTFTGSQFISRTSGLSTAEWAFCTAIQMVAVNHFYFCCHFKIYIHFYLFF